MTNRLSSFAKKTLFAKNRNLVSLDEPFEIMVRLLKGQRVTGILDAGASSGRISRRLLRKFPEAQAYAFEPQPVYADTLKQLAKEEPRLHPQFLALSDSEGRATLHVTESPGNTSLLAPAKHLEEITPGGSKIRNNEEVQLVTLDNWAGRNGNPAVELMKFDIQGAELKALRGGVGVLRSSTLLVYTEIAFNSLYEGGAIYSEIDLFLRENGFRLYDLYKPKYGPNGLIMWANAIFVNVGRLGL